MYFSYNCSLMTLYLQVQTADVHTFCSRVNPSQGENNWAGVCLENITDETFCLTPRPEK